ncbi:RND transporter [Massilia sp. Root418]|jgi:multidrug efflux system outer membrane protein|uniref:TolC family protein n=1 Tax=Massilia sp. Root418 TaxID=1736532 RepID=UPI00070114CD|nr:TolC family protein [Massilia sp. Root418]KQW96468.1 RND transporter [Massilia sp. Root418]
MSSMISTRAAPPLAALLAALLLTACAAPAFKQPAIAVPAAFKEAAAPVQTAADGTQWRPARAAEQQPRGQWWLAFNDPALTALIEEATRNNASLAGATARVKQARAIAGIAEADRVPQVGVNAGAQRALSSPTQAGLPPGTPMSPHTSYTARLTASYEVDLFGRVSSGVAAARNDAATAEAAYRSVLLALQADVAQAYFRLRATDAELATLARTVQTREENVQVNQRRFDLGDIGEFDLARARTELSSTRADAIGLQRQRATTEHALAVLLGRPAADFTARVAATGAAGVAAGVAAGGAARGSAGVAAKSAAGVAAGAGPLPQAAMPVIPPGLPSALLERRPDIAAAQRAMEASNARIGVARAAMFPALDISASGGGVAGSFPDVFKMSSRSWLLGALLSAPLIDGGRNQASLARSEAVLDESVAAYRQSVLAAFAEVEDNLAGLRILAGQAEQVEDALKSARRSAALAQALYEAGRSSYLELLDAQRNLAGVERTAVQLRGSRAITTVALIRALGGGWGVGPG